MSQVSQQFTASIFPTIPTSFVTDSGTAIPALNTLNIFGGTDISTSGAGNTVTISFTGAAGGVTSVAATAPLTANGFSGVPETGAVTIALATPLKGDFGGTGIANVGLTIDLSSGAVGKYLASDSSGNGTWATLSSAAVTSISATAPITVSASTGAVTVGITTPLAVQYGGTGIATLASGNVPSGAGTSPMVPLAYSATGGTSNLVSRDANGNSFANNFTSGTTSNAAGGAPINLNPNATRKQITTGVGTQTYKLPNATQLNLGTTYDFNNNATGIVTINDNSNTLVTTVQPGGYKQVFVTNIGSPAGSWDWHSLVPSNTNWGTTALTAPSTTSASFGSYLLTGTSSGTISILPQAGAGTYNFNLPTTAGTSGDFLTSGGGGSTAMTWTTPSSSLVTSISGTANQIAASASVGAVTLSLTNGISIGSFQATTPPTGGAIFPGNVGIGINSAANPLTVSSVSSGVVISGTTTAASGAALGAIIEVVQDDGAATSSGDRIGVFSFTGARDASHTLQRSAVVSGWAAENWSGTATGSYILLETTANTTTSRLERVRIDQNGVVGIGTIGGAPSSLSILNTKSSNAYNIYATGTQTLLNGSSVQVAVFSDSTMAPASGSTQSIGSFMGITFSPPGGQTITAAIGNRISNNFGSTGTITTCYGLFVDSGGAVGTTTVNTHYAGYFTAPSAGTNKIALYTDNQSIGYTNTVPPSLGIIVSGQAGFATTSPDATSNVNFAGTQTTKSGGNQFNVFFSQTLNPTGGSTFSNSLYINTSFIAPTATTITNAAAIDINNVVNSNVGTISSLYGLLISSGSSKTGTVTNSYAAYVTTPAATGGTATVALYSDNASVGFTAVTPPSSGLIVSGQTGIGLSSLSVYAKLEVSSSLAYNTYLTGSTTAVNNVNLQLGLFFDMSFAPTSGSSGTRAVYLQPGLSPPTGQTMTEGSALRISNQFNGLGTITDAYGVFVDSGSATAGTITNHYGGFFTTPTSGTKKIALYSDNHSVGFTATTPPSNGLIVSGNVGIGTSTAATPLTISSGSNGFIISATCTAASGSGLGPLMQLVDNDGAAMSSGDRIAGYFFAGARDNANTISNSAGFTAWAAENWSGTAAGTYIAFETTANTTTSRAEKMRLDQNGNLAIGASTSTYRITVTSGDIATVTVGNGYRIAEGSNARMGTVTMSGGTATVSNNTLTANSRVFYSRLTAGGTIGNVSCAITVGSQFVLTSTSGTESSLFDWIIFEAV